MMDGLYSASLLVALVSAAVSAVAGIGALRRPGSQWARLTLWSAFLAMLFGVVSFAVHFRFGHGPETPEPMMLGQFLSIHPAYGVVLLLALIGIGAWALSRPHE